MRLVVITAISVASLPLSAQVNPPTSPPTTTTVEGKPPAHRRWTVRRQTDDRHEGYRDRRDDDGGHRYRGDRRRYDPEAFRQMISAELAEIPGLNQHMVRLMDIQAQRFELQKQRQAVARARNNRDATIKKFHGLLQRDQILSDEARKIVQEIVKDMPQIQQELIKRREVLSAELAKANSETTDTETTDTKTSSSEAREVRRRMRYVDYLENKLLDMTTHPERLDILARVLRGLPHEDPATPGKVPDAQKSSASTPEDRLAELQMKRQVLQRELQQVEEEIENLQKQGMTVRQNRKKR